MANNGLVLADGERFTLTFRDGRTVTSSALPIVRGPVSEPLRAVPRTKRAGGQPAGQLITVTRAAEDGDLSLTLRAWVRPGAPYLRQELVLEARGRPIDVASITLFELPSVGTTVAGTVDGSPLLRGNMFFAVEHPMAKASVTEGGARVVLARPQPLRPGQADAVAWVIGASAHGQLRRVFRDYVEQQRAHRHRPFLQYNSWFDVSWAGKTLSEGECLGAIAQMGLALRERGVTLDAFVFDDGWDAAGTLWEIDSKRFPSGFSPLAAAARRFGSGIGVWMSPWGGYDPAKAGRLEVGRRAGFRITSDGLSLADPDYFARFRETAARFVADDRVRYLKFDGVTAREPTQTEALFRLIRDLRALKSSPALFVNVTVGTWPSPFWLWHGDSIWRGGEDMGFVGAGEKREQWISYRDAQVYRNVVRAAPLFPLSALMTHGIVNGQHGPGAAMAAGGPALTHDLHAYFGSGVALQELYVTPSRLQPADWDVLAEAARWARRRAAVLADSHWVGGDPAAGDVYGWAAFDPTARASAAAAVRGVLVLRNPQDRPADITLTLGQAFELPASAPRRYRLSSPWKSNGQTVPPVTVAAADPHRFSLAPFEVRVLEARAAP